MKHALILLFLALTAYAQMQERVAIINTLDDYDSISVSALTYLTDRLREVAVNTLPSERFGVMTTESIVAFLGSMENTIRVCKESSCLAELGRQVSADYIAQGRIGRFEDNLTIKVELYNVKSGNLMGSFTGSSKDIAGLLVIIDEKATDLFKRMLAEPKVSKPEPSIEVATPASQPVLVADSAAIANIQALIEKGIEKNKVKIQKASFSLSNSDKMALYKENEMKSVLGYVALNVLPGFGVGSYIQGSIKSGIVQSVFEVVGWYILWDNGVALARLTPYDRVDEFQVKLISYSIISTSRLLGLLTPSGYKNIYNKTLREALNFHDKISYSIEPLIVPRDGTPALGLAFNVRY